MAARKKKPKKDGNYTKEDLLAEYEHAVINPEENVTHFIPTGDIKLDAKLKGGLARGKISEFWGPNRGGKSTIALCVAASVMRRGGTVYYLDGEQGLDIGEVGEYLTESEEEAEERKERAKSTIRNWLAINGVNPYSDQFVLLQPDTLEEAYRITEKITLHALGDLVVFDSLTSLRTQKEIDGEIGDSNYGHAALINSQGLKAVVRAFKKQPIEKRPHILLINQARAKIGGMASGSKSSGGFGVEHYTSLRAKVSRIGSGKSGGIHQTRSIVKLEKVRWATQDEVEIVISSIRGIDVLDEVLEYAEASGYVHTSGAYYYFYNSPLGRKEWEEKVKADSFKEEKEGFAGWTQGREKALQWMIENDWREKLYDEAVANWLNYF